MKKLTFLSMFFSFIFFNEGKTQIVLDTTFTFGPQASNYQLIRLEKSGYKWLITDPTNFQLSKEHCFGKR